MALRLLLVDDHKLIRDGLKSLIAKQPEFEVIGEAGDGLKAVSLVKELKPDIVIMDVSIPELNGYDATRQIVSEFPDVKVIALSMHSDRRFVLEMLKAGANGYMIKDCAFEEITRAVTAVWKGQTYLSPQVAGVIVGDFINQKGIQERSAIAQLSEREREVLKMLAEGHSTKEIASKINLSIKTIETHRKNIMDKLGIRNIAALTKLAIREGLTSLDN
jgi:two-component system response regulator NreC